MEGIVGYSSKYRATPRLLIAATSNMFVLALFGCDPGIVVSQTVVVRIANDQGAFPVSPTLVYRISHVRATEVPRPSIESIFQDAEAGGQTPVPVDEEGNATIRYSRGVLCVPWDSGLGPSCAEAGGQDFVTGHRQYIGIRGPSQSEIIAVDIVQGTKASGEAFSIEVVDVQPPVVE